jgi:hypothetical protein
MSDVSTRPKQHGARIPLRGSPSLRRGSRSDSADRRVSLETTASDAATFAPRSEKRGLSERARELDRELRCLSRRDAEGRRVLGLLAHRFIELRGYEFLGFARLSDYATERLGCSGRQVEESARVAHLLSGLRQIEAAFLEGRIGWSKVRLLVSLCTPDNETKWLEVANKVDVRTLSELTRNARSAAREQRIVGGLGASSNVELREDDEDDERVLLRIECNRKTRLMWSDLRRTACRMAGRVLAPWEVAELVAAEASTAPGPYAAIWQEEPWKSLSSVDSDERSRPLFSRMRESRRQVEGQVLFSPADGVGDASVAHELDDLAQMDATALDTAMRRVRRWMQEADCLLGRALDVFVSLRLHEEFGYRASAVYAAERLGMSERSARELVHVTHAAAKRPCELSDAYAGGRLTWLQVRTLLPVVRPCNALSWIARAEEVTLRRLTDEVEWAIKQDLLAPGAGLLPPEGDAKLGLDSTSLAQESDRQMCANGGELFGIVGRIHVSFVAPVSVGVLFRTVLQSFAAPQEPRWLAVERMFEQVLVQWNAEPRHRDPVFARDGFRCTAPGCSSFANLHDHHIVPRSAGGSNDMENRTTLCAWHHLRAIHGGLATATGSAPDGLQWEMGIRGRSSAWLKLRGDRYVQKR